jgi:hypothetical protein
VALLAQAPVLDSDGLSRLRLLPEVLPGAKTLIRFKTRVTIMQVSKSKVDYTSHIPKHPQSKTKNNELAKHLSNDKQ